ncbi:hypothetical protein FLBR109950_06905 [Flavobacterium branchiophilum]
MIFFFKKTHFKETNIEDKVKFLALQIILLLFFVAKPVYFSIFDITFKKYKYVN